LTAKHLTAKHPPLFTSLGTLAAERRPLACVSSCDPQLPGNSQSPDGTRLAHSATVSAITASPQPTLLPNPRNAARKRSNGRPLRIESEDHLFFVTSRTRDSVFWLHPLLCSSLEPANRDARRVIESKRAQLDARLARMLAGANKRRPPEQPQLTLSEAKTIARNLIHSALARAQACCAAEGTEPPQVFAAIVMSNHVHLVVRAPGKNLARFVGYFKARVATSINLLLGRSGNIWHRRYDAQAILSDEHAVARVRYTLANPQKARLVRHLDEWPGFVALKGRTAQADLTTEWTDWTAWHRARRPQDRSSFRRTTTFCLHKLPAQTDLSDADYLRDLLADIAPVPDTEHVLGIEKVLATDFDARPERPKRTRRPYAFGQTSMIRAYFDRCRATYAAYGRCRERFLRGELVTDWPPGTYAPGSSRAA
jgi:REP element-mobilizing transposase RayT